MDGRELRREARPVREAVGTVDRKEEGDLA